MSKPSPKDQYRMTLKLADRQTEFDYRVRELSFLSHTLSPCFKRFVTAIGLWQNYSMVRGFDHLSWRSVSASEVLHAACDLHLELDQNWHLYGHDYWFRGPSDWSKRRGLEVIRLRDGRGGLLAAQIPGQLQLKLSESDQIIDLRGLARLEAESPPELRFYKKANDIRWRERLSSIIDFLRAAESDALTLHIRHHYVNDPETQPKTKPAAKPRVNTASRASGLSLVRALNQFYAASRSEPGAGRIANELGGYDDPGLADKLVAAYQRLIAADEDAQARLANVYSLAGHLKRLRRYQAAQELLESAMQSSQAGNLLALQSLYARVLANLGDEARARALAEVVNANTDSPMFRITEAILQQELARARSSGGG